MSKIIGGIVIGFVLLIPISLIVMTYEKRCFEGFQQIRFKERFGDSKWRPWRDAIRNGSEVACRSK